MDNKLYPKSYNPWAGNPGGVKPDYTRCCEEVRPNERGGSWHMHQCSRKRGFGPDEAYCKQHDPEAVAKRDREAKERWEAASLIRRYEWYGKRFYSVLKQISEGHNDARGLASNMINDFERKK